MVVTQLEVVAIAFVCMSILAHIIWWYKPRGVTHPIVIPVRKASDTDNAKPTADGSQIVENNDKKKTISSSYAIIYTYVNIYINVNI